MIRELKKNWRETQAKLMGRYMFAKFGIALSLEDIKKRNSTHYKVEKNLAINEFLRASERKLAAKMLSRV